jgi:hemerythrin-like metal-binding protein
MALITWSDKHFSLGITQIDDTHREFVAIINALDDAHGSAFLGLFTELLYRTREHFEKENQLMVASDFPARNEHETEHRKILAELIRHQINLKKGIITMARSCVREKLPHWFILHATTMDAALAAHLKQQSIKEIEKQRLLSEA